jgi:hypothetical protein
MATELALVLPYLDTNAMYQVMQDRHLMAIPLSAALSTTAKSSPGTDGNLISSDLMTSPDTAFEVHAVAYNARWAPESWTNVTSSGFSGNPMFAVFQWTYFQPTPPASGGTTSASTSGNLRFRNIFWESRTAATWVQSNVGSDATYQNFNNMNVQDEKTVILPKPIRVVGTGLNIRYVASNSGDDISMSVHSYVLGRYVHISDNEYVNLIALATGQAILPPSILG